VIVMRRLRDGDFRGVINASSVANQPSRMPGHPVATGLFWRNAMERSGATYRHFGWDNGTLTANLLAMAAALGLPSG